MAYACSSKKDRTNPKIHETINLHEDAQNLEIPSIGMLFQTKDEAREYYKKYAIQNGFRIRTRTTHKKGDVIVSMKYVCAKEGNRLTTPKNKLDNDDENLKGLAKKKLRNVSSIRCECQAFMRIRLYNNEWLVCAINDVHNHEMVNPIKRVNLDSNRQMPDTNKSLTDKFSDQNIEICEVVSNAGENLGFDEIERDPCDESSNLRALNLDNGDEQDVITYLKKRQAQNPQFYYAIQCDENERAINFFFVDAYSRSAYQYFGDVVSFDNTYRTNKYNMLFAPFIGVNHHMQSIQFGCAILQDETEVSFKWLFETWLEAMGGEAPKSFITNQDLAIKTVIAKVFPNTCHRLCVSHIMKKFGEKLSQVYYKKSKFKKEIKNCIWNTYKEKDFEDMWMVLMREYELENIEWIQQLYDIRGSWVPVYNRETFFAGMNTNRFSECVYSFFDEFVTSKTNLSEIVIKYDEALKRILTRERDEDYESEHTFRNVMDEDYILKHAAKIYTRNIFNLFKEEMVAIKRYKIIDSSVCEDGSKSFLVGSHVNKVEKFTVTFNIKTYEGSCECRLFQFVGILCRHILKVLNRYDVCEIPVHFILPRWMQKVNKVKKIELVRKDDDDSESLRLNHMCQEATRLAILAAQSHEGYEFFIESMNNLNEKLSKVPSVVRVQSVKSVEVEKNVEVDNDVFDSPQILITDPITGRMISGGEISIGKRQRRCSFLGW